MNELQPPLKQSKAKQGCSLLKQNGAPPFLYSFHAFIIFHRLGTSSFCAFIYYHASSFSYYQIPFVSPPHFSPTFSLSSSLGNSLLHGTSTRLTNPVSNTPPRNKVVKLVYHFHRLKKYTLQLLQGWCVISWSHKSYIVYPRLKISAHSDMIRVKGGGMKYYKSTAGREKSIIYEQHKSWSEWHISPTTKDCRFSTSFLSASISPITQHHNRSSYSKAIWKEQVS